MPLYEYEAKDGTRREVLLPSPAPIMNWDGKKFRRVEVVPFALAGFKSLPSMGDEVLRGYHDREIIQGSRFRSRLPAERIKRTWADETTK